ncbi:MAG: hypothetical protein GTO45_02655 [Candidatus Aminicenantes bacterium]|nr:hypothetical protein [Candidatus Aminicenantes bacterium]NIM77633.1 hypothetical protein [Candidatus Aminicenantes bacterium]NIN16945.1 hypothetical protein [Candidatus Aminicenantes bacterium]NIN40838.1 hypothetical protein [Candidatus Aminicenantes bacterium]NIN83642.1 hypothetical protein [Candidatus Aminicenantes bacterium]
MRKLFSLLVILALLTIGSTWLCSRVQVGEEVSERIETAHPYKGGAESALEWVFNYPNAGYIAIHFSGFDLAPGDHVEISSPDGKFSYRYAGKGKVVRGGEAVLDDFWATHIPGDTAVVKLHSQNSQGGYGFVIDKWIRGYEQGHISAIMAGIEEEGDAGLEAICSADDKEWAKCYEGTTMYEKSRTVSRLLITGMYACTGWLLGSEGHLLTNHHCIEDQYDADNTDYEFMAEGATCTTPCNWWGACPGVVEADSGDLVKTNTSLDYSLILLPVNLTSQYGYLQFRDELPTIGERIYIPQHPQHWGKQLAVLSDVDGGYAVIFSTSRPPCTGGPGDIGYYADTAGGSSGSPVLAYDDHLVVALHHCAYCPNRGVPIPNIITDMGAYLPADAIGNLLQPPAAPTNLTATAVSCSQIDLTWQDNSDNEDGFSIERSLDGITFTVLTTIGADETSFSDTNVVESTTYWYRVRAFNAAGYSGYSNVASATTPPCPGPPAAPTELRAKPDYEKVYLEWKDNSDNEDAFVIYRAKLSPTSIQSLQPIAKVRPNTTSFTDTTVEPKTYYYYQVCAVNEYGKGCSRVIKVFTAPITVTPVALTPAVDKK